MLEFVRPLALSQYTGAFGGQQETPSDTLACPRYSGFGAEASSIVNLTLLDQPYISSDSGCANCSVDQNATTMTDARIMADTSFDPADCLHQSSVGTPSVSYSQFNCRATAKASDDQFEAESTPPAPLSGAAPFVLNGFTRSDRKGTSTLTPSNGFWNTCLCSS